MVYLLQQTGNMAMTILRVLLCAVFMVTAVMSKPVSIVLLFCHYIYTTVK